jgi:hypothetical protein
MVGTDASCDNKKMHAGTTHDLKWRLTRIRKNRRQQANPGISEKPSSIARMALDGDGDEGFVTKIPLQSLFQAPLAASSPQNVEH